jgi:hypothetical protein
VTRFGADAEFRGPPAPEILINNYVAQQERWTIRKERGAPRNGGIGPRLSIGPGCYTVCDTWLLRRRQTKRSNGYRPPKSATTERTFSRS